MCAHMPFAARPSPAGRGSTSRNFNHCGFQNGSSVRENLGGMADQHVQAISNSVNVVLPCTTFMWAPPKSVRESVYSIHRGSLGRVIGKRN
jgi:hypothetical protein